MCLIIYIIDAGSWSFCWLTKRRALGLCYHSSIWGIQKMKIASGENCIIKCNPNLHKKHTHTFSLGKKLGRIKVSVFKLLLFHSLTTNKNPRANYGRLNLGFLSPTCSLFPLLMETTNQEDRAYMHQLSISLSTEKQIKLQASNLLVSIFPLKPTLSMTAMLLHWKNLGLLEVNFNLELNRHINTRGNAILILNN